MIFVQEVKRRYVIPGEVVASGNVRADINVVRVGVNLFATRVVMSEVGLDTA